MDIIWNNIEKILALITVIGSIGIFFIWLLKNIKKPNSNTEKRFSAEDVNALTEQERQAREDEKKRFQEQTAKLESELEHAGDLIGVKKLAEAQEALAKNDLPKADKLFAEIEESDELTLLQFADVSFARGYIAEFGGQWGEAAQHYTRAAKIDPSFDTTMRAQSLALAIDDYDSALPLGKAAKKLASVKYGKDSAEYANSLNELGAVYQAKGEDTKAEVLFNETLIIHRKLFGKFYYASSSTLNNLAEIYKERENFTKAEQFFKKSIEIDKKYFGEEHHQTATGMNNLANLYRKQKKYTEADSLYQQALAIRKKMLEKNHPDIGKTYNNLAVLYAEQGRFEEVEPFYLQAIQIFETFFGHEHPDTKTIKSNYKTFKKHLANTKKTHPNKTHHTP